MFPPDLPPPNSVTLSWIGNSYSLSIPHDSCLVPVDITTLPTMYVFVDISIDIDHLVASVELNFE